MRKTVCSKPIFVVKAFSMIVVIVLRCRHMTFVVIQTQDGRKCEQRPSEQCRNSSCYQTINSKQTVKQYYMHITNE